MNGARPVLERKIRVARIRKTIITGSNHHFLLLFKKLQNSAKKLRLVRAEAACSNLVGSCLFMRPLGVTHTTFIRTVSNSFPVAAAQHAAPRRWILRFVGAVAMNRFHASGRRAQLASARCRT